MWEHMYMDYLKKEKDSIPDNGASASFSFPKQGG